MGLNKKTILLGMGALRSARNNDHGHKPVMRKMQMEEGRGDSKKGGKTRLSLDELSSLAAEATMKNSLCS